MHVGVVLLRPAGLRVGQLVRVEYDSANPEQVRVAGRTWATGVVPAAITFVVLWALIAPIAVASTE